MWREEPSQPLVVVPQPVRTSSERAAAPSLCSSWGSGSRPSGSRDHLGLCDPHNPGAMSFATPARCEPRPRGHLRPVNSWAAPGHRACCPRVAGKSASRLTCPSRNQSRARARSDHGFESNGSALPDYASVSSHAGGLNPERGRRHPPPPRRPPRPLPAAAGDAEARPVPAMVPGSSISALSLSIIRVPDRSRRRS